MYCAVVHECSDIKVNWIKDKVYTHVQEYRFSYLLSLCKFCFCIHDFRCHVFMLEVFYLRAGGLT